MIDIKIPSKKPPKVWYSTTPNSQVKTDVPVILSSNQTIAAEAARRDSIVRKLAFDCPYKPGDTVVPVSSDGFNLLGSHVMVTKICSSYAHMGKDEKWPANDNPMIVHVWSKDKNSEFFCTTDYLKKGGPNDVSNCDC